MKTRTAKPPVVPKGMQGIVNDPTLKKTRAVVMKQYSQTGDVRVQLLEDGRTNPYWHSGDEVTVELKNFDPRCVRCGKRLKRGHQSIYCDTCGAGIERK